MDEVIYIQDYMVPLTDLIESKQSLSTFGREPTLTYSNMVTPKSAEKLIIKPINKKKYVKIKELDLGDNNAYFCIGKMTWYYLRDFHSSHIGLRNTNLDWQIIHLEPFSMGTNKFSFCLHGADENYERHMEYFFDDKKILETVSSLPKSKVLTDIHEITAALTWATNQPQGCRFGLDYETNGLWKNHKYEDLVAIGVGISTKDVGFYIELRSLSNKELSLFKEYYKKFLDKNEKNIWVFNIDFEMIVTRKLLGPWATYEFKDADIWRVMYGDQIGYSKKRKDRELRNGNIVSNIETVQRDLRWSLKYTAQKYLKVPSWDNDFEELESKLSKIFEGYKIKEVDDFLTNPIVSKNIHSMVSKKEVTDKLMTRVLKRLCNPKKITSIQDIKDAFDIAPKANYDIDKFRIALLGTTDSEEVYAHPIWKEIELAYPKHIDEFKKYMLDSRFSGNQYAVQPTEVVGKYCIIDSYYTVMIAEYQYEKDFFTKNARKVGAAPWATTEALVEIFNANKALGGMLNMYGLYKSNTVRSNYNEVQEKVRIFCNYILAKGYNNMLLHNSNSNPHPSEKHLSTVFKTCIKHNLDPVDFKKITKKLFPLVYDSTQPFKWNDSVGESLFGKTLCYKIKDVLLDYFPKGFKNESAYSRSVNVHRDCSEIIETEWKSLKIPASFDWLECRKYYDELEGLQGAKDKLKELETFNIKGMTLNEVLDLDKITYVDSLGNNISMSSEEAVSVLKKQFFDVATATEVELGQWFEDWKPFRILFTMYNHKEFKSEIDAANIFSKKDDLETKVTKFKKFVENILETYVNPKFINWKAAKKYAVKNNFNNEICNPDEKDLSTDPIQARAYIEEVISEDIYSQFKVTKKLVDTYLKYFSLTKEELKNDKEKLLKYSKVSPLSYKDPMLDKGYMCSTYDTLVTGDETLESTTEKELHICNIDSIVTYKYYPIMTTCFKLYRKYDKLGQYLNGQLVDNDYKLLGEDEDGVPLIGGLTKEQKHKSVCGNKVKMFPRYEIMQKATKRNSSGIHKFVWPISVMV